MIGLAELLTNKTVAPQLAQKSVESSNETGNSSPETAITDASFVSMLGQMIAAPQVQPRVETPLQSEGSDLQSLPQLTLVTDDVPDGSPFGVGKQALANAVTSEFSGEIISANNDSQINALVAEMTPVQAADTLHEAFFALGQTSDDEAGTSAPNAQPQLSRAKEILPLESSTIKATEATDRSVRQDERATLHRVPSGQAVATVLPERAETVLAIQAVADKFAAAMPLMKTLQASVQEQAYIRDEALLKLDVERQTLPLSESHIEETQADVHKKVQSSTDRPAATPDQRTKATGNSEAANPLSENVKTTVAMTEIVGAREQEGVVQLQREPGRPEKNPPPVEDQKVSAPSSKGEQNLIVSDPATNQGTRYEMPGNGASPQFSFASQQGRSEFTMPSGLRTESVFSQQQLPEEFARNLVLTISNELKLHIDGRTSQVRVVMKPESMGELSLRVSMEEGQLTARMDVTQPAVKSALEAQLPQLRHALAAQGIDVQRFDIVSEGGMQFHQSNERNAYHQHNRSKQNTDVDVAETFENIKHLGYNTVEYII